jgi:hypothetical protein
MHKLSKQTAQWARQKQKKDGLADVLTKKLPGQNIFTQIKSRIIAPMIDRMRPAG